MKLKPYRLIKNLLKVDIIIFWLSNVILFFVFMINVDYPNMVYHETVGTIFKNIAQIQYDVVSYFNLKKINADLIKENERLHNLISDNYQIDYRDTEDGAQHRVILTDSVLSQRNTIINPIYVWVRGNIIQTINRMGRMYFVLNLGANDGIQKGMPVLGMQGVAGKVIKVYPKYALAASLYNKDLRISAKITKNGSTGILQWDKNHFFLLGLKDIANTDSVTIGDSVYTSHLSYTFPENILIGVVEAKTSSDGYYNEYAVRPIENPQKLEIIYIIKNKREALTDLDEFIE